MEARNGTGGEMKNRRRGVGGLTTTSYGGQQEKDMFGLVKGN